MHFKKKYDFSMLPHVDRPRRIQKETPKFSEFSFKDVLRILALKGVFVHSEYDIITWSTNRDGSLHIHVDGNITVKLNYPKRKKK